MTHVTKFKVALNLAKQSVTVKIAKGRHYVTSMTGNVSFPTPNPTLASVTTAVDALELASDNADGGGTEETAIMHEKETIVDTLVTKLGRYVEDIANDDPANAVSIVLSAGMDLKKPAVPVGPVLRPENLRADVDPNTPGQIKLTCKKPAGVRAMIWQKSSTPGGPPPFAAAPAPSFEPASGAGFPSGVTLSSKHIAIGLESGTTYTFRVAAVGAANQSGWSDVAIRMAP